MKRLIGIALLVMPAAAQAAKWFEVATTDTGSVVFVDLESRRGTSALADIWIKIDHSKNATKKARESKELWRFNCASRSVFTRSYVDYAPNGSILHSGSNEPLLGSDYEPIIPESTAEAVYKVVCPGS